MKIKFLIALSICLNLAAYAQIDSTLNQYGCLSAKVIYLSEGEKVEGLLLFVNHFDREIPLAYSNVYLVSKDNDNRQLIGDSVAFTGVNKISVSPDSEYLALHLVGEGHPWIEIYDLQELIEWGKLQLLAEINPYPGIVNLVGWQENKLLIESDINMLLLNNNQDLDYDAMSDDLKSFHFNLKTGKYEE